MDSTKLTNVYDRWRVVLDLIIEDNGGDQLIEAKRGKLFRAPSSEIEDLGEGETERVPADEENITAEEVNEIDLDLV